MEYYSKNKDLAALKADPNSKKIAAPKLYSNYGVTTSAGGQIASRAQEINKSFVKNTGTISIQSDNSIGVGILNSIQSVEVGKTIDIGTSTLGTYGDKNGNSKVDGAVGVYTEEATRPVAASTYKYTADGQQEFEADGVTPKIATPSKDDHGIVNTELQQHHMMRKDANGKLFNRYAGK